MPLVGELIVRARNSANDPCQCMNQPFAPSLSASGAGTLTGSLFGILTWLNQYGETIGSGEVSVSGLSNNQAAIALVEVPVAATSGRFYFSSVSGREEQYVIVNTAGPNFVGTTGQAVFVGTPPYKPSAFLPDSDGDLVSVFEMYRWINAGLARLGRAAGGILDQTGVAMPAGNAEVVIPGWWLSFKYIWHNGWLTLGEEQSYTWLQSPVSGIPGISTLWRNGAKQVLGTWPQPSTAPAITFLTAPMGAGDNLANVQSTADFHGTDGAITLGSFILNSATGGFPTMPQGLAVTVVGAGAAGGNLVTTVASYISPNQVQLALPALTAVTSAVFDITGSGGPGFTAPGMMQIDNENMSYSIVNPTQITGIVRGYSGTIASPHAMGAAVYQLIFRILGRRMPVPVSVGQAANILDVPQGWDEVMDLYLAAKYQEVDHHVAEAKSLLADFDEAANKLQDKQIPLESKQVGGLWPFGTDSASLADAMDVVFTN